jgi:hypothetical protein
MGTRHTDVNDPDNQTRGFVAGRSIAVEFIDVQIEK